MSKISTVVFNVLCGAILFASITARATAAPEIYLQAPSAEAPIIAGTDCAIAWRATEYTGAVDIRLWDGERGCWSVIAGGIAAERKAYTWRVPRGLTGNLFRIEVRGSSVPDLAARSGAFLSIREGRLSAVTPAPIERKLGDRCIARPNPCSSHALLDLGGRVARSIDLTAIASGISYPRGFVAEEGGARIPTDDLPTGAYVARVRCTNGDTVLEKLLIRHAE